MNRDAYFSIKGYTQHFNQYIKAALNTEKVPSSQILMEGNEDMELENAVVQVKYHERQDYFPCTVKKAVQYLYDGYDKKGSKKAILLCYFKNKQPFDQQFTSEEILQNFKITGFVQEKLDMFSRNFILRFDSNFGETYSSIILKIKETFLCESEEEARICYSSIFTLCLDKVNNNPKGREQERYITFEEIYQQCPNNRKLVDLLIEKINSGEDVSPNFKAQIKILPQKAKAYFFDKLEESEQGRNFIQDSEMEEISGKLEKLFISNDLKRQYYYSLINLISPIYTDGRGIDTHTRLQQLFRIDGDLEDEFIKRLKEDDLLEIKEGICIIRNGKMANGWLATMVGDGFISIEDLIQLFE